MRRLLKILCIGVLMISMTDLYASDNNGTTEKLLLQLINQIDTIKQYNDFIRLAYNFENIATNNKNEWLPYYYAGLCWASAAGNTNDNTNIDKYCDKAQEMANSAKRIANKNSEVLCLEAIINSSRIKVDMQARGLKYVTISNNKLKEALLINKNNPRAYYLLGVNTLSIPEGFGGGKESAKKYFLKAHEIYTGIVRDSTSLIPYWGERETSRIVRTIYKNKN